MSLAHFRAYVEGGMKDVEGWVVPSFIPCMEHLFQESLEHGVRGGCCEIGVHHGKLFIAMLNLVGDSHRSLALDIFEDQFLNVDLSGKGAREVFEANVQTYSPYHSKVTARKLDSTAISTLDQVEIQREFGKFHIFSVDGGHTPEHAFNDMVIAESLIANGGLVFLDDFFHHNWPGVTEGFFRYFAAANRRLAPVAISGSKLVMTTVSYHKVYVHGLDRRLREAYPSSRVKSNRLCGWEVISFSL